MVEGRKPEPIIAAAIYIAAKLKNYEEVTIEKLADIVSANE